MVHSRGSRGSAFGARVANALGQLYHCVRGPNALRARGGVAAPCGVGGAVGTCCSHRVEAGTQVSRILAGLGGRHKVRVDCP